MLFQIFYSRDVNEKFDNARDFLIKYDFDIERTRFISYCIRDRIKIIVFTVKSS